MTFVIAAAGTGGHVYPALSVARELVALGVPSSRVGFFGGTRMEADAVPAAGFAFTSFRLARLERSPTVKNLTIPSVVRWTARAMTEEIAARRGRVMLGMGGYVVVPAALAAHRAGIPFMLQEQNASPGLASRFAARRAAAVFVGLPGRAERLPRATLVGNPLRPAFEHFDRDALRPAAFDRYGLRANGPVVGILGGSLGARVLNEAAGAIAAALGNGALLHVSGPTPGAQAGLGGGVTGVLRVHRTFEPEIQFFYAAADLVVCRAGAMTVSELSASGTPAVLVPMEGSGQRANAAALATAGGAVVVEGRDMARLADIVAGVANDPGRLRVMAESSRRAARPGAARAIAAALVAAAEAGDA